MDQERAVAAEPSATMLVYANHLAVHIRIDGRGVFMVRGRLGVYHMPNRQLTPGPTLPVKPSEQGEAAWLARLGPSGPDPHPRPGPPAAHLRRRRPHSPGVATPCFDLPPRRAGQLQAHKATTTTGRRRRART
jgi:hypothetical protein